MDVNNTGLGDLGRLPASVRQCIYSYAGLPRGEMICLDRRVQSAEGQGQSGLRRITVPELELLDTCYRRSFGSLCTLLLTCRAVSDEASAILYAENTFLLRDHRVLRSMRPSSLRQLTQLTVLLHLSYKPRLVPFILRHHGGEEKDPLDPTSPEGRAVLDDWVKTAKHLARHVPPGRLEFRFVCDISGGTIMARPGHAELIMKTLRHLPRLAAGHFRLGAVRNRTLIHEARLLAAKYMPLPDKAEEEPAPFRFMDLPRELRLAILQFTDLVIPSRRIMWRQIGKFQKCISSPIGPFSRPSQCIKAPGARIFCQRNCAAWSPGCACWMAPGPLFGVCRQLTEDARLILFGACEVSVEDDWTTRWSGAKRAEHYAPTVFFSGIMRPETLRVLRRLTIVSFSPSYVVEDEETAAAGWSRVREEVRRGGLLDLDELKICGGERDEVPWFERFRTEKPEVIFAKVRALVHEYQWPLDEGPEGMRPMCTRRLTAEMGHDLGVVKYVAGELIGEAPVAERPAEHETQFKAPAATRVTMLEGGKMWLEQVFIRIRDMDEWEQA